MNWILGCLGLLLGVGILFLLFELRNTRRTYQQIYDLLVRDRDALREEVVTLREALFPQLKRVVARSSSSSSARQAGDGGAPAKLPSAAAALPMNRTPWRIRFKQQVAAHNTPQKHLDKIAEAAKETNA